MRARGHRGDHLKWLAESPQGWRTPCVCNKPTGQKPFSVCRRAQGRSLKRWRCSAHAASPLCRLSSVPSRETIGRVGCFVQTQRAGMIWVRRFAFCRRAWSDRSVVAVRTRGPIISPANRKPFLSPSLLAMIDSVRCSPLALVAGRQLPRRWALRRPPRRAGAFLPRPEQVACRLLFSGRVAETSSAFACP